MMMFEKFTLMVLISAVGAKITKDPFPLKVLSLNTWGMPDSILSHLINFGSDDKVLRMKAIGDLINKAEYDIYLLQDICISNILISAYNRTFLCMKPTILMP